MEKKVFNRKLFTHKVLAKIRRPLCLLLSLIFILLVITIFMLLIIPEIRQTVITVAQDLPKQVENLSTTITTFLQRFDLPTDQTSLGKIVLPLREQNPGLTGFHVLYNPLEALAARIHLID
ncbi:MAG: hypothetical protein RR387_03665, partial [Clostridiales bacterium]